ncbi:MAG: transposase [Holdemanella sp.]|uniref:transposase n=1 Tax=Holdemanella sp. TaxID=1971762 RepID=UPI002F92A5E5
MIATIHTFGRDLKWNPHIHCLILELVYSQKTNKHKMFHHFNFSRLRKTFQYQLIHLIIESGGLSKLEERNRLYKDHTKGFYVYAKFKSTDNDSNDASSNKNSKDIQGCVNYFIRYAGRPAMAENRITEYNKESNTVSWFYNDHKDEKRYDVTDNVIDSFNRDPIQCKCGAIMQYTYTYNPFKDKRNDRTYRKRCIDGMMRMYKRRI